MYELLQQAYGEDAMGRWVVQKCLTGSVNLKMVEPPLKRAPLGKKKRSCYWRFLILRVSYTTSMLPTSKQLTTEYKLCLDQKFILFSFTESQRNMV
jgi:hypothetical protein